MKTNTFSILRKCCHLDLTEPTLRTRTLTLLYVWVHKYAFKAKHCIIDENTLTTIRNSLFCVTKLLFSCCLGVYNRYN